MAAPTSLVSRVGARTLVTVLGCELWTGIDDLSADDARMVLSLGNHRAPHWPDSLLQTCYLRSMIEPDAIRCQSHRDIGLHNETEAQVCILTGNIDLLLYEVIETVRPDDNSP